MSARNLFAPYDPEAARPRLSENALCVRPATTSDAAVLAEIALARDGGSPERHVRAFRAQIADDGSTWHVAAAVVDAAIVGYGRVNRFTPPEGAPPHVAPAGWYLAGLVVDPAWRRRGVGHALTTYRLGWLEGRTEDVYYFANARNQATIDLHAKLGFEEVTRDFIMPGCTFTGGVGILFRLELRARP